MGRIDKYIKQHPEHLQYLQGIGIKSSRIEVYYNRYCIIEAIKQMLKEEVFVNKRVFLQSLNAELLELKKTMPHNVPNSVNQLYTVFNNYTCNEKHIGNNRKESIVSSEQLSILKKLCKHPNNLNNEQIAKYYNQFASATQGFKPVCARTVSNYIKKYKLEIHAGRKGINAIYNDMAMQVPRMRPSAPNYYWTLDGWTAELLYQDVAQTKDGGNRTTYHNRLTVVVVLDPYNNYPVGYAIGKQENVSLITAAIRNAIDHTQELFGKHYSTWQIQSDNYQIKTLKPIYEQVAKYVTPARVGNAKSKVVESYFGNKLNRDYCQIMRNWSGFGITARKEHQPNQEYLNMIKSQFPDKQGCEMQIAKIIEQERKLKVQDYVNSFNQLSDSDKLEIPIEQYLYLFGDSTEANKITGSGLTPKIMGVKTDYDCFDIEFRKHFAESWTVKYDPKDLSRALAVSNDGKLRFMLKRKYAQPMALKDRIDGDAQQLERVKQYNKGLLEYIKTQNCNTDNIVMEFLQSTGKQEETLSKLLLTDSRGQHKDNMSAARLAAAKKKEDSSIYIEECTKTVDNIYDYY